MPRVKVLLVAILLAVAAGLVALGVGRIHPAAGLIASGVLLAAWVALVLIEVDR